MKAVLRAVVFFACAALGGQAFAFSGAVTCSVLSTTLTFNAYNPISGAADTLPTGTITVQCTNTAFRTIAVTYNLTLATTPARAMASGANSLTYNLYTDTARSIVWNTTSQLTNGAGGTCPALSLGARTTNVQSSCSFYGSIPGSQNVPAGTYTQTGLAVGGTWSCNQVPSGGC